MSSSGPTKRKSAAASSTPESSAVSSLPRSKAAEEAAPDVSAGTKYLILYNLICFIIWYCLIVMLIVTLSLSSGSGRVLVTGPDGTMQNRKGHPLDNLFPATFEVVKYAQTLAVLEVVHAAVGLVRAGLLTTTMQVGSRLLLVWGILAPFGKALLMHESFVNRFINYAGLGPLLKSIGVADYFGGLTPLMRNQAAYSGMLVAWAVTECVRYMFFIYFLAGSKSMAKVPSWLSWMRYNSFFVLYPVGISCECWLIYHTIPLANQIDQRFGWAFMAILGIYAPGSYILYTHMIKQRARIMSTKKPKARTE